MLFKIQLLFVLIASFSAFSQDERLFRDLFKTDFSIDKSDRTALAEPYKWKTNSPLYEIDLDANGNFEGIIYEKRDGEDWIHIMNPFRVPIFSKKIQAFGKEAFVYKIQMKSLSQNSKILIVYFYEGNNSYLNFSGQTRLYFITIDNNNLKSLSLYKGPIIESEQRERDRNYQYSSHSVELFDYNHDQTKELVVKYNTLSKVYMYRGDGNWSEF